jgi:predicted RNase H-like HicB family nuclease
MPAEVIIMNDKSINELKKDIIRIPVLKGYIEQVKENDYFAICLTLNLVTRGSSLEETEHNLHKLIKFYLQDAVKKNELAQFVPRRAPWSYWMTYYKYLVLLRFTAPLRYIHLWQESPESLESACA